MPHSTQKKEDEDEEKAFEDSYSYWIVGIVLMFKKKRMKLFRIKVFFE